MSKYVKWWLCTDPRGRRAKIHQYAFLVISLGLFCAPGHFVFADTAPSVSDVGDIHPAVDNRGTSSQVIYDSRKYVVRQTDSVARWLDGFFGDQDTEEEAPYSVIRLRLDERWIEGEGWESSVGIRGKVHLPKLSERVSLLFNEVREDLFSEGEDDNAEQTDDVALQYNIRDQRYYRLDARAGLRSSGNPKLALRYRYSHDLTEQIDARFIEEVRYQGGDGFSARTRLEFDRELTQRAFLRWSNRLTWEEHVSGVNWGTEVSLNRRIAESRALSYFVGLGGETQPSGKIEDYGAGVRYRRSVLTSWFFIDFQPEYIWRRQSVDDSFDGQLGFRLRFTAVFEKDKD